MVINIPGIDTEKGLNLYGDDEEIYLIVLNSYVSNMPAVLEKIRSVSEETLPAYSISVHGIKGTSANIGAVNLQEQAAELERMAKAGNLAEILARNESFVKDVEDTIKGIETWLEQNPSSE